MSQAESAVMQRLKELKNDGASPVAAIKAIHLEFGLSLAEAKQRFADSPSWRREAADGDRLHIEIVELLSQDLKR